MSVQIFSALLVLFLCAPWSISRADGAGPLVTDRPDFTESAQTVPYGRIQLEGGYTFARFGIEREHTIGELLLRIGVANRMELRFGFNSLVLLRNPFHDNSGVSDGSFGAKIKPFKGDGRPEEGIPEFAVIISTSLPTGSDKFREETLQPAMTLALAWDLREKAALRTNLNYSRLSEHGDAFHQISGSVTFACSLSGRTGCYLEYYGFVPDSKDGPNSDFIDSGLTLLLNDDHQLDLRLGVGLNEDKPDYFLGLGASRRW